jgi:transcriptional regulator
MAEDRGELLHGALEMLILQTLTEGPQHGFAISEGLLQASGNVLTVHEGSMYPALYRMQKRGWIDAEWGHSEKGKRAKFYKLTRKGRQQLREAAQRWSRFADAVGRVMAPQLGGAR